VRNYYMQFEETQTQSAIDDKIMNFAQHARPAMPLVRPASLAKRAGCCMLESCRAAECEPPLENMTITVICVHNLLFWADCSLGWARQCRWGIGRQWACRLQGWAWAWACARPWACQVNTLTLHDVAGCEGAGIRHSHLRRAGAAALSWTPFDLVCVPQACRRLAMGARPWACHLRSSGRRQVSFCLALF
jgi:hypothetical protein